MKRLMMQCQVPASASEDCIQEAWLALLERHPDWDLSEARASAWLLAVALWFGIVPGGKSRQRGPADDALEWDADGRPFDPTPTGSGL